MIVRVPATTANVGCGFDTVGLALELFNEFRIQAAEMDALQGAHQDLSKHMVFYTRDRACEALGLEKLPMHLTIQAHVPLASGLGSSSTCVIAGVIAALYLHHQALDPQLIQELATRIEGHPDNVVPAYQGGFVAALMTQDHLISQKFEVHPAFRFVTVTPGFEFSTSFARRALPQTILHREAVANLGRIVLLAEALKRGESQHLHALLADELHEKYRLPLIFERDPAFEMLYHDCCHHAAGTFLSGAGPTIISVDHAQAAEELYIRLKQRYPSYHVRLLRPWNEGTLISDETTFWPLNVMSNEALD